MTDLEQQLTEHLRRRAAAATPRYDLEGIEQGTGLVSLVDLDDRRSRPPTSAASPNPDGPLVILESSVQDGQPSEPPIVGTTRVALEPRMTSHRWRVVAAAAVIVLAAAAVLAYRSGFDTTDIEPADVTDVTSTTDPAAQLAVADSFMDAWDAGDGDALVALIGDPLTAEDSGYIEPGQELSPVSIGPAIDDVAALPALHDWFRAVGWELRREPCRPVGSSIPEVADSAEFVCNYTYENDLTRPPAAGRSPTCLTSSSWVTRSRRSLAGCSTSMPTCG